MEIERDKIIKIYHSSGIQLNSKIYEKNLFSQSEEFIQKNYEGLHLFLGNLFLKTFKMYKDQRVIEFSKVLMEFRYFQWKKKEQGETSTGTQKTIPLDGKINDKNGGSQPLPPNLGGRGSEPIESKELTDIPIDHVPDVIQKRKDDFGIWISQEALRHFKTMCCHLEPAGSLFGKIENHFVGEPYSSNGWANPIKNEDRDQRGLTFSMGFTKGGYLRLYLSNKNKDYEKFFGDLFDIFGFLEKEELIEFLESLILEERREQCFIHDAREIGPKKTIDEKFKGAHVKINQVKWFGDDTYDVRIDYSKRDSPHIEAEGPQAIVGNFMKVIDGDPEFTANLSDIRELSYRTRDKVHENFSGIGQLSSLVMNNSQQVHDIGGKLFGLEILQESNQIELMKFLKQNLIPELETLIQQGEEGSLERRTIRQAFIRVIAILMNFDTNLNNKIDHRANGVEDLVISTSNDLHRNIDATKTHISSKLDNLDKSISSKFDNLRQLVLGEFQNLKFRTKNGLYVIMQKLDQAPGLTAKAMAKELQIPQKKMYTYLKKLRKKNFIYSQSTSTKNQKGRPPKAFYLNLKKILKKLKKSE